MGLGDALSWLRGFAADEVESAYNRAHELAGQMGETMEQFRVVWGLWHFFVIRDDLDKALEFSQEVAQLGERLEDPSLAAHVHRALGETLLWRGDFAAALRETRACTAGPDLPPPKQIPGVQDPILMCGVWQAVALWHLGYPDQALAGIDAALERAKGSALSGDLVAALFFAAVVRVWRRETASVREFAQAARQFSVGRGLGWHVALCEVLLGSILVVDQRDENGLAQIRDGADASSASGAGIFQSWFGALQATAQAQLGDPAAGLDALAAAEARVGQSGERWIEAEIHRVRGELLASVNRAGAEPSLLRSIEVARAQQARSLELRAATSLARLWAGQGERQKAHDLLAPIYAWFTEGFDTPDLKDAKALLEALR
jgi:predicted ATPase